MIENDVQEPLETYHVYRAQGGILIRKEEEPFIDSTPVKVQPHDNHGAVLMLACSFVMALLVVFIPNTPITQQINLVHSFAIGKDLQSYTIPPVTRTASQIVATTGIGHTPATVARGYLTLYNGSFTAQDIPANMIFTTARGVQIITDSPVSVPQGIPPNYGQATVSAHALQAGAGGNIRAYEIDSPCCFSAVKAINESAFVGGRDARDYHTVRQQDIKAPVLQPLYNLTPDAVLLHGSCSTKVSANHRTGEEATSVKVSTFEACSGSAYSRTTLQKRARQLVPIPPGFLLQAMAVHVVQTTPTGVTVLIQCFISYNFTEKNGMDA